MSVKSCQTGSIWQLMGPHHQFAMSMKCRQILTKSAWLVAGVASLMANDIAGWQHVRFGRVSESSFERGIGYFGTSAKPFLSYWFTFNLCLHSVQKIYFKRDTLNSCERFGDEYDCKILNCDVMASLRQPERINKTKRLSKSLICHCQPTGLCFVGTRT